MYKKKRWKKKEKSSFFAGFLPQWSLPLAIAVCVEKLIRKEDRKEKKGQKNNVKIYAELYLPINRST